MAREMAGRDGPAAQGLRGSGLGSTTSKPPVAVLVRSPAKVTSIWRRNSMNGTASITSPGRKVPSMESRLTKRSAKSHNRTSNCPESTRSLQSDRDFIRMTQPAGLFARSRFRYSDFATVWITPMQHGYLNETIPHCAVPPS